MAETKKSSKAVKARRKVATAGAKSRKNIKRPSYSAKKTEEKAEKTTKKSVKVTNSAKTETVKVKSEKKTTEKATSSAKKNTKKNTAKKAVSAKKSPKVNAAKTKNGKNKQIKVEFINEKVEKRPLNSEKSGESAERTTKSAEKVKESTKIQHFASDEKPIEPEKKPVITAFSAGVELKIKPASESTTIALEKALDDFATEHPEIEEKSAPEANIDGVYARMERRKSLDGFTARNKNSEIKLSEVEKAVKKAEAAPKKRVRSYKITFGFKRVVLALAFATVAVFAIVYFVNANAPDVSLKVAAMQSGINATYPAYIPRDYNLSDITSENGKITLNFKNPTTEAAFSIVEEASTWDATALYNNYVKSEYKDDVTTVKENGITIYIGSRGACWISGNVVYKIKVLSGSLTKKQIVTIATTK